jgi:Protein of unknown function (DUF3631)
MIGRLPDTLNDRSIVINLRRRKATERVQSFRSDRAEHLTVLAHKMARWAQDHGNALAVVDPDMNGLENRTADNWRPLLAIADEAGGRWPKYARKVASTLVQASVDQSTNAQLLADIRWLFDRGPDEEGKPTLSQGVIIRLPIGGDAMTSAEMVEQLIKIEGRPWADWKGKPLTQNSLARLLARVSVQSGPLRLGGDRFAKGYKRSAFDDAFDRYIPSQSVTASQPNNHGHCDGLQSVTAEKACDAFKSVTTQ